MSLSFGLQNGEEVPSVRAELAHEANDEALRMTDVIRTRDSLDGEFVTEVKHRAHQKLLEDLRSRRIILYALCPVVFAIVLLWEWHISREIYSVYFPTLPAIPFLVLTGLAFIASACFAEATSTFSLLSFASSASGVPGDSMIDAIKASIYDRTRNHWHMNPRTLWLLIGLLLGITMEGLIFFFSRIRVDLMVQAGEMAQAASAIHLYLPVILFAVEIAIGIPTFYFFLWLAGFVRIKLLRKKLTKLHDAQLLLRRAALEKYANYLEDLSEHNRWAQQNERRERMLIPPNNTLRSLLVEEYGYDPTGSAPAEENQYPGNGAGNGSQDAGAPDSGAEDDQEGREEHLLNLLDQRISDQNRTP